MKVVTHRDELAGMSLTSEARLNMEILKDDKGNFYAVPEALKGDLGTIAEAAHDTLDYFRNELLSQGIKEGKEKRKRLEKKAKAAPVMTTDQAKQEAKEGAGAYADDDKEEGTEADKKGGQQ